jgi:predicted ATPase/class 3 adenylate cyclase
MGEGNFVLPTGTVTLVLGDVEGSTRAWEADPKAMEADLAALNAVVDEAVGRHDGVRPVEQGEGDSFVAAFARARDAVACALAIQKALVDGPLRLRVGVHAGDVVRRDEGNYAGPAINRAARIRNTAQRRPDRPVPGGRRAGRRLLAGRAELRDLGVHRLQDLSRPERIFQLCHPDLTTDFPSLRSLDAQSHNLPVQRTSFVGRRDEMAEVKRLVVEESLVTLVGSGGCGKTRLAVHVAAEVLDEYADGVWLADLAAVADPDAVATQVGQIFALKEGPGMTATDALAAFLGGKRALLVLDNCEHVLAAAATLADRLMSSCPSLLILATSRQPLDLPGEVAWRVPSLAVPDRHDQTETGPAAIAGLAACEAVQLFVDRASRARPGFALTDANSSAVADICRRLDGIPLAIELAAARVRVFTPAQIAAGLDQRFALLTGAPRTALPRQQTLEASVGWSHDLLTEAEQAVFRRLSVFAGSFDFDATVAVCAAPPIAAHQVLDQLSLLVDKSLVLADDSGEQARYRLLETVRDYAARRLADTDEEATTRTAHLDHYLAFAEEAGPQLEGPGQTRWMARIAAEYPNVRTAFGWSCDCDQPETFARMAAALPVFWASHGPGKEGASRLDVAVANRERLPMTLQAAVLFARMWIATIDWDPMTIFAWAEEGQRVAREVGDDRLLARMQVCLGMGNVLTLQPSPVLDEAIALARSNHDEWALSAALWALGGWYMNIDPTRARPYFEEAVLVGERSGNRAIVDSSSANLGSILGREGNLERALVVLRETLGRIEDSSDRFTRCVTMAYLALVLVWADERREALEVTDRLEATGREAGIGLFEAFVPFFRGMVALSDGDIQNALRLGRDSVAAAAIPITRGATLCGLIEAELAAGEADDAMNHIEEVIAIDESAGASNYLEYALTLRARHCRQLSDFALAETVAHEALDISVSTSTKPRTADSLEILGGVAASLGRHQQAARLFGAGRHLREDTGYRPASPNATPT